jgi:hypothetical protein
MTIRLGQRVEVNRHDSEHAGTGIVAHIDGTTLGCQMIEPGGGAYEWGIIYSDPPSTTQISWRYLSADEPIEEVQLSDLLTLGVLDATKVLAVLNELVERVNEHKAID